MQSVVSSPTTPLSTITSQVKEQAQLQTGVEQMDQALANQSPTKQVLDIDSMEEDETPTEPTTIEEVV